MNFETIFTQSLPVTMRSLGKLVFNYLQQYDFITMKHYFMEPTRTNDL